MEFGLAYEMQRPSLDDHAVVEETIEQCILADEMGFDYVWFVEHHFLTTFSSSPCPEVIFGALSRLTKNIRLGFGVVILPYHHPVRVAERVAMVDQLSHGRVDLGTGRSAPYEQTGMGIDPRNTRGHVGRVADHDPQNLGVGHLRMVRQILERSAAPGAAQALPAAPSTHLGSRLAACAYQLAANKGIGVMALGVSAPSVLEPHIQQYRETVQNANPVGATVNNQWLSSIFGYCGEDNSAARELCTQSLKTFFGPGRPYVQDQKDVYARLLEQWGGIPEHLVQNFSRYIDVKESADGAATQFDLSGGTALAQKIWEEVDGDTLADRGVIVAGDPESCINAVKLHEATGVDQVQFLMATETIGHANVMKSIELFGKHVIPAFK